jgi:von Willebrand factor type A domain
VDALTGLQFPESHAARLTLLVLGGLAIGALLLRTALRDRTRATGIGLPALVDWTPAFPGAASFVRHGALVLALTGLPFFFAAFADPHTLFTSRETSYPGRRINLMIDASSSMLSPLPSTQLAKGAPNDAAFFTTVGAARHFVELRMRGKYRDLVSLIEFGDDAYVITPFTSDYENILLSISLIGDWSELMAFPDQGTMIARAIDQGVGLFKAFDFLDASGNLMVIFSDGMDAEVLQDGRTGFDVLRQAAAAKIPVYFVRVGGSTDDRLSDAMWQSAVARTGGRFYSAADEATIVRAVREIDEASTGRITMREYSTRRPVFPRFAMAAGALWTLALGLRFTVPWFQRFP